MRPSHIVHAAAGINNNLGSGTASQGSLTVTGAGSSVTATGATTIAQASTDLAFVTLADGGALNASGAFTLASAAGSTGVLNIGGAEGNAAARRATAPAP